MQLLDFFVCLKKVIKFLTEYICFLGLKSENSKQSNFYVQNIEMKYLLYVDK